MKKFRVSLADGFNGDEAFLVVDVMAKDLVDLVDKVRENEELAEYCYSNKDLVEWWCSVDENGNFPEWSDDMIEGCIYDEDGEMCLILNEVIEFRVEEIS
jgi:hypothetical protein